MAPNKSQDCGHEIADQIPPALFAAVLEERSGELKLPRAVLVSEDEMVVYQACKVVGTGDLEALDKLTAYVATLDDIKGDEAKAIHKVRLAGSCDEDMRLQARKRGIRVLTKDELLRRRKTLMQ
jgi:hypothetical protein